MGHRANLVVIRNGKADVYYSHWRANTLDVDLFWGPEPATAFAVRQRSEAEGAELLDDVWAEGGAIIDHDARTLLWFGGEDVEFDIPRRRLHLRMMRELWPAWTVRWASEGILDVAVYLGVPREKVLVRGSSPPTDAPVLFEPPKEPSWILTVVTTRSNGRYGVRGTSSNASELLRYGAALLEPLRNAPGSAVFDWPSRSPEFPTGGLHVDFDSRAIGYWFAADAPGIVARTQAAFADWNVTCWYDAYEEQLAAVPDLALPARDVHVLKDALIEHLSREERDLSNLAAEFAAAHGNVSEINPLALRDDVLTLSAEERRKILETRFSSL